MHISLLRAWHCKHVPFQLGDSIQRFLFVGYHPRTRTFQKLTGSIRVSSFIIIFIEIPLLLRICPTSSTFDSFMQRFTTNYMRALIYFVMAAIQWISIAAGVTSLIAAAVLLTITASFYALAGVKGQAFTGSKTLGGQGVAQMIV